jgi:pyrroline-5-carboxylate reductase
MLSSVARIAIIGGGNIGEALLAGLLQSGRQVKDLVVAEARSTPSGSPMSPMPRRTPPT